MNGGAATRRAILVLGAHRGGTSLATRILNLLGAALPDRLVPANASNERGHWEPHALVALNDAILSELGTGWDDWGAIPWADVAPARAKAWADRLAGVIAAEYPEQSPILLKDPRICRMLPLYDAALAQLGMAADYVIVLRNPSAAAASLAARDDIILGSGALLWLRHLLEAEHVTRGRRRIIVRYEELHGAPDRRAQELAAFANLEASRPALTAIGAFVSPALAHHRGSAATSPLAAQAHAALLALLEDPLAGHATAMLDACRARLDDLALYVPTRCLRGTRLIDTLLDERKRARMDIDRLESQTHSLRQALAASTQARRHAEARLATIEGSASWRLTAGLRAAKAWLRPRPVRRAAP